MKHDHINGNFRIQKWRYMSATYIYIYVYIRPYGVGIFTCGPRKSVLYMVGTSNQSVTEMGSDHMLYAMTQAVQDLLPIDGRILTSTSFAGCGAKGVTCIKEAWRQQQQLEGRRVRALVFVHWDEAFLTETIV